jgi:hypothetical protein
MSTSLRVRNETEIAFWAVLLIRSHFKETGRDSAARESTSLASSLEIVIRRSETGQTLTVYFL